MTISESILPSESTNSNSELSSLSSSPSLSLSIVPPSLTMVGMDQEKEKVQLDVEDHEDMGLLSPTATHQSQPGNQDEDDEGDDTVIIMPGSLSSSSSSASIVSLPRGQGQVLSPSSLEESTIVSPFLSQSRGVQAPSSHGESALEMETPTVTGITDDARLGTSLLAAEALSSIASISRTSSVTQSSASSPSSGISLAFNSNLVDLGGFATGVRPRWPTLVEDGLSTSSVDSSGFGSSTASLTASSSASESTATTTIYPLRYSAKEKGKGKAAHHGSVVEDLRAEEDRRTIQGPINDGEIRLKSIMKKSRKRYRRVPVDDDVCTKHGVIQEDGISRDFLLLVALCLGLACAGILVVRPAVSKALGRDEYGDGIGDGFDLFED